jgi:hypothetical protein
MSTKKLLAKIEAITKEDVENAILSEKTGGTPIGPPIRSLFLKKLVALYSREDLLLNTYYGTNDRDNLSPTEFLKECVWGSQIQLLGAMLAYELELHYGKYLTEEERSTGEMLIEVREGWQVFKIQNKIPIEESEEHSSPQPKENSKVLH